MPLAVTHVLITLISVGLYRDYLSQHKRYFTRYTLILAAFAGLFPDLDIPLGMVLSIFGVHLEHGSYFHTPLFAVFFLLPGLYFYYKDRSRIATYFFVITFGIALHLLLDYFLGGGGGIMFMWPFSDANFSFNLLGRFENRHLPMALDALLLLFWISYLELRHKLVDVI